MINLDDYRMAWQVYLGVGALAMLVWFLLLRRIDSVFVRYWLLFAALAFLFIPSSHPAAPELWVPGSTSAVLSLLTEGIESALPSLILLAGGQILALILALSAMTLLPAAPKSSRTAPAKPEKRTTAKTVKDGGRKEPAFTTKQS